MTSTAPDGLKRTRDAVMKGLGASDQQGCTSYRAAGSAAGSHTVISGRTSWCPRTPTFVVEDALHLHAAPGVGDAQGTAGDQALGRG